MKKVVIFVIFGATDAMVLVITSKRIELVGCACAQNEALGEQNSTMSLCDTWVLSERGRSAENT